MILIIAEENDQNINGVIDWIVYLGFDYCKISSETKLILKHLSIDDSSIDFEIDYDNSFNHGTIRYSEIQSVWYRSGKLKLRVPEITEEHVKKIFIQYFNTEIKVLNDLIYRLLCRKRHINTYLDNSKSKLHQQLIAKDHDISIPSTHISSYKNVISNFVESEERYVTKAIEFGHIGKFDKVDIGGFTESLEVSDLANLQSFGFPSLLQKQVEKKYEIRSFYLDGEFYSSAIFSQNDEQTRVDFRNYNFENMNRVVPYKIPDELEDKLRAMFKELDINSGSIDLIFTSSNEYVFLEINPIGQFQQVSQPCNYNLPKIIAEYLCKS